MVNPRKLVPRSMRAWSALALGVVVSLGTSACAVERRPGGRERDERDAGLGVDGTGPERDAGQVMPRDSGADYAQDGRIDESQYLDAGVDPHDGPDAGTPSRDAGLDAGMRVDAFVPALPDAGLDAGVLVDAFVPALPDAGLDAGMRVDAFVPALPDAGEPLCTESPNTCIHPPEAQCEAGMLIEHAATGVCGADGCTYPVTRRRCALGCEAGACRTGWDMLPTAGAPSPRYFHTAVWTGTEMIVWGGHFVDFGTGATAYLGDGARYDPRTNIWRTLPTSGAPSPRYDHIAVWSGTEMLVWGGHGAAGALRDGARYDPVADRWRPITTSGAPSAREASGAAWTGTELLVWGGMASVDLSSGGRYDPRTDTWRGITTTGAPSARRNFAHAWTGSRFLVWAGAGDAALAPDGAAYDAVSDRWTPLSRTGAPTARSLLASVWTDGALFVWGGTDPTSSAASGGALYVPGEDRWQPLPTAGAPSPVRQYVAAWSGNDVLVHGGRDASFGPTSAAALFTPRTHSWRPVSPSPLAPRYLHTAVWTGDEWILWGGAGAAATFGDGARLVTAP